MGTIKLTTMTVEIQTRDMLLQVAKAEKRSMTKQLDVLVYDKWVKLFGKLDGKLEGKDVVGIVELPGPDDCQAVPVVLIQQVGE